jgi:hypothetical protein
MVGWDSDNRPPGVVDGVGVQAKPTKMDEKNGTQRVYCAIAINAISTKIAARQSTATKKNLAIE